jgi:hypothetical protein
VGLDSGGAGFVVGILGSVAVGLRVVARGVLVIVSVVSAALDLSAVSYEALGAFSSSDALDQFVKTSEALGVTRREASGWLTRASLS